MSYEPPQRRKGRKRIPEKHSSCTGKTPYFTEFEAIAAIAYIEMNSKQDVELRTYRCHYCEMWHLTSQVD